MTGKKRMAAVSGALVVLGLAWASPAAGDPVPPVVARSEVETTTTQPPPQPSQEGNAGPRTEHKTPPEPAGTRVEVRAGDEQDVCEGYNGRDEFLSGSSGARQTRQFAMQPDQASRVVVEHSIIGVAFFDGSGQRKEVPGGEIKEISVRMGETEKFVVAPTDENYRTYLKKPDDTGDDKDKVYCIPIGYRGELKEKLHDLADGARIEVKVKIGESETIRHARRRNAWRPYGFDIGNLGVAGLWFPVGLFASNLKTTNGALEFSALPIGMAIGGRRWWDGNYIGLSAIANWSISSTREEPADESMPGRKEVNVDGIGVGALLDLSSLIYVGGIYITDIAGDDPGWMVTVGIGPGLITALSELGKAKSAAK